MSEIIQTSVNSRTLHDVYIGMTITARNGYTYTITEPIGKNYSPDFNPVFTPIEMLKMGVFEGKYLNDDYQEYPIEFFKDAKVSGPKPNEKLNMFRVKSRLSTSEWEKAGLIHRILKVGSNGIAAIIWAVEQKMILDRLSAGKRWLVMLDRLKRIVQAT